MINLQDTPKLKKSKEIHLSVKLRYIYVRRFMLGFTYFYLKKLTTF